MNDEDLIRAIDALEGRAAGYLTLSEVEDRIGHSAQGAIERGLLLVDYRQRVDAVSGEYEDVTLARLNRQHPMVRQLTAW